MSRLSYKRGPKKGQEFLGQAMFLPGDRKEYNPIVTQRKREGLNSELEKQALSKWDYYKQNYGYKDTLDSSKAASSLISKELLKDFPKVDSDGNRLNDPDTIYRMIKPIGIALPWWLDWKLLAATGLALYFGPGILGRYRKGRA